MPKLERTNITPRNGAYTQTPKATSCFKELAALVGSNSYEGDIGM